jgi:hypothetical protein
MLKNPRMLIELGSLDAAPSSEEIRRLAKDLGRLKSAGLDRVAVLGSNDVLFGLARMLTTYAELAGVNASAFRSAEDAQNWLG